nr:hypothetical protein [Tanacetum cinerariifolium]
QNRHSRHRLHRHAGATAGLGVIRQHAKPQFDSSSSTQSGDQVRAFCTGDKELGSVEEKRHRDPGPDREHDRYHR